MKKQALLNAPISELIARLGHGDQICIADAGLPIPDHVTRIDLAVTRSIPSFLQVFDTVVNEMMVERMIIASELVSSETVVYKDLKARITDLEITQGNDIEVGDTSHEMFKTLTHECKAVIRTGECTPYANVILCAGVCF